MGPRPAGAGRWVRASQSSSPSASIASRLEEGLGDHYTFERVSTNFRLQAYVWMVPVTVPAHDERYILRIELDDRRAVPVTAEGWDRPMRHTFGASRLCMWFLKDPPNRQWNRADGVDPSLAALRDVHSNVSIRGWLDAWCHGWARFDVAGRHVWGWDGLLGGERSVLRIFPEHDAAIVLMTNGSTGRAMYRSLFADLLPSLFDMAMPALRLEPSPSAAGDLSRYVGVYAWPDRRVEVASTARGLIIKQEHGTAEALPIDERTFLVDPTDPDNPTVTFAEFAGAGRPRVLYLMLWGLPRVGD